MSLGVRERNIAVASCLMMLALIILLVSCNKSEKTAEKDTAQKTFASPDEAGEALVEMAKSGNQDALLALFGPGSKEVIYSGDAAQDKESFEAFVSAYQEMHRWRKLDDRSESLLIGADNFAFPIPLKKSDSGHWYFDTPAGKDEILARRVGRNELAVIDVCAALADAQAEYFAQRHEGVSKKQYALKFISDNGKQDGLYWESPEGQPRSPLGPLVAFATSEGYTVRSNSHEPFHGYYFRILNKQGSHAEGGAKDYLVDGKMVNGFAFVAYPAEYGNSGVMTFIINQSSVVFQKDLGKTTAETATAISEFDPDTSWSPVEE